MSYTLITGACLVDGTGRSPVEDSGLLLEDGRIAFVGSRAACAARCPQPAQSIDASGLSLLPGIIDAHVHVAGSWSDPEHRRLNDEPEYLALWTAGAAQEVLRAGITTIGDCGARHGITLPVRDAIAGGLVLGPRILACGPAITTTAGHGDYIGIGAIANNADQMREAIRFWVRRGVDFIKIMATGGSADPASMRRRAQYSTAELKAGVDDAHRLGKRVVVHVNGTEGIRNSVAAGVDVLAHCNWLGVEEGTIDFDEGIVQHMADQGIMVDLNAGGILRPLLPSEGRVLRWHSTSQPRHRWDIVLRMKDLGVKAYFTSDACGPKIATFPEQVCQIAEQADIPPLELVRMVTQLPATGLGLDAELGTLEPGKVADILAVEGDPSKEPRALTRVKLVIRSGRIVVSGGMLTAPTRAREKQQ